MSGMRPTGRLHLGHYLGAIENWRNLQNEHECFYSVVDWHALTTGYRETGNIKDDIREIVIDWISGGVDPERSTLYVQSSVPQIAELHLLLSMTVPVAWLERVPTYKEQIQELGGDIATYGFLGYPLLQVADIAVVKGEVVPVGADQLPHLEFAREIIRRFHFIYRREIFPEPEARLTSAPLVPGWDGRKMSKSYGNSILLSDDPEAITKKIMKYITDPQKIYKGDPGRPEICNIFHYHEMLNREEAPRIEQDCKSGALGCVACKKNLAGKLIRSLEPFREKRKALEVNPCRVTEILETGGAKVRDIASRTMEEVREVMKIK